MRCFYPSHKPRSQTIRWTPGIFFRFPLRLRSNIRRSSWRRPGLVGISSSLGKGELQKPWHFWVWCFPSNASGIPWRWIFQQICCMKTPKSEFSILKFSLKLEIMRYNKSCALRCWKTRRNGKDWIKQPWDRSGNEPRTALTSNVDRLQYSKCRYFWWEFWCFFLIYFICFEVSSLLLYHVMFSICH